MTVGLKKILYLYTRYYVYYQGMYVYVYFFYMYFCQKKSLFFSFNFETSHMPAKSQISTAQILFTVVFFFNKTKEDVHCHHLPSYDVEPIVKLYHHMPSECVRE